MQLEISTKFCDLKKEYYFYSKFSPEMIPYSKNIFKHGRKKTLKLNYFSETKQSTACLISEQSDRKLER